MAMVAAVVGIILAMVPVSAQTTTDGARQVARIGSVAAQAAPGPCGDQPCPPPEEQAGEGPCGPEPCAAPGAEESDGEGPCGAQPCPPPGEDAGEGPCGPEPCPGPEAEEAGGQGPCGDRPCPPPGEEAGPCGPEPCASPGAEEDCGVEGCAASDASEVAPPSGSVDDDQKPGAEACGGQPCDLSSETARSQRADELDDGSSGGLVFALAGVSGAVLVWCVAKWLSRRKSEPPSLT